MAAKKSATKATSKKAVKRTARKAIANVADAYAAKSAPKRGRGRPLKGGVPRTARLDVRLSDDERAEIVAGALEASMTLTDFLLAAVRGFRL